MNFNYIMQYMNAKLLPIVIFTFVSGFFSRLNAQCEFTLFMGDSFGDGWTGATLTITNGDSTYVFGLNNINDDGNDSTVVFTVKDGLPIILSWQSTFFNGEDFFRLYDADGTLLYKDSIPNNGNLYNGIANCPTCYKPKDLTNANIYDTRAKLKWTSVNPTQPVGWKVIYGPKGFVPGPGVGDTVLTALPKVTLTGLQKKTAYDWYLVQDCGNGDFSKLAGPISFETYWTNDVGIVGVASPKSGCDLGVETVKILMQNFGASPQSLIPYRYSVNGKDAGVPQPQDGFYTGVLGKDSIELIAFETTYNFSDTGEYLITVYTQMGGDEDFNNDTFNYRIVNRLGVPYAQDFESWSGGWFVDTGSVASSWQYGIPKKLTIDTAASGIHAWFTNNSNGSYNINELSYLSSPCFDFSGVNTDPVIDFALNLQLSNFFDGLYLESSIDGGQTWKKVGLFDEGLNWYNNINFFNNLNDVWAGANKDWVNARHILNGTAGQSEVHLRFVFSGNQIGFSGLDGVGIDNIKIYEPFVKDLAGKSVTTLGESTNCGLQGDRVSFTYTNFGSKPQSFYKLAYSVNGGAPKVENIGATVLSPDQSAIYVFNTPFDSRNGTFVVKCWPVLSGDQKSGNDTITYTVAHLPITLPLKENFEANGPVGLLPNGWSAVNGFIGNGHANVSYVYYVNMYDNLDTFTLTSPRYGYVSDGDSLNFQYRITDWSSNGTIGTTLATGTKMDVQVSDDCGDTFTTVYTISKSNHTPTANFKKVFINMSNYAGKAVILRFKGKQTAGDFNFDLDNINLNEGITAVQQVVGLTNLSLQPNPTSGNFSVLASFEQPVRELQVSVLDLVGKQIWSQNTSNVQDLNTQFDLSAYPAGMYFVRLLADGKSVTRKVVKQ
jgi:hypothetical protein